jgi:hypothetical protein
MGPQAVQTLKPSLAKHRHGKEWCQTASSSWDSAPNISEKSMNIYGHMGTYHLLVNFKGTSTFCRFEMDRKMCRLADPDWPIVAMAPEGTTSNGKQLLRFRTGAFIHAAPVLPVCISYKWRQVNPAWTICNEPWHVLRVLTQFVNVAQITILPPHYPNVHEIAQPATFAENVRKRMVWLSLKHWLCTSNARTPVVHK